MDDNRMRIVLDKRHAELEQMIAEQEQLPPRRRDRDYIRKLSIKQSEIEHLLTLIT